MRNVIQAHLICVLKLLRDKPSFPVRIALKRLGTLDRNQSYGNSITFGIASKDYALLEIDSWVDVFVYWIRSCGLGPAIEPNS